MTCITTSCAAAATSGPPLHCVLLYNKIRPGLKDRFPDVLGHSELELQLPEAIKNGVGSDFVSAQVCVSYPYCRAHDRITLKCNGELMYASVSEDEAPPPPDPGSATPSTVCFTVTRAFLDLAKRPDQKLNFSFTVTDQLGNTPDTDAIWSATQIVDEDLDDTRLSATILREILEDFEDDRDTFDLGKLGALFWAIVLTEDRRFVVGHTIVVTLTITIPGQSDVELTGAGTVERDGVGQKKPCVIEFSNDPQVIFAAGVVKGSYELFDGDQFVGKSRIATVWVIGNSLPYLKAPRLQKSFNDVLDPLDPANREGANGQVEVLGFEPDDTVQLIVEGAPGAGSPTFTAKQLNTNNRANFPLNSAFIAANMGNVAIIWYLFFRNGKQHDSQVLTASIGRIPDYHPSLPTPTIDGITAEELDVTQQLISLQLDQWVHQVPGQCVWLLYEGFAPNGAAVSLELFKGEPHNGSSGFSCPAAGEWLRALGHGTMLTISFKVSFDQVFNVATAVAFPKRIYEVKSHVPLYDLTNFNDGTLGGWATGSAGVGAYVMAGVFTNPTNAISGNAGTVLSKSFKLIVGHSYKFSYRVRNYYTPPVLPILSVVAGINTILPVFTVPSDSIWYSREGTFTAPQNGVVTISIVSHEDRGGQAGEGGNDYNLDELLFQELK